MRFFTVPEIIQRIVPNIIWRIPCTSKQIFLTFDDGPSEIFTPQILDILAEHDAKATFFLLGEKLKPNRNIVLRMRDSGHTIGIHGYHHVSLLLKSKKRMREQTERAKDELESLIQEPVRLFRPPYGRFNRSVLEQCRHLSLRPLLWSFMTYDFDNHLSDSNLLKVFQQKIHPGDIVVLHDGHTNSGRTVRLLPQLIRHAQNQGFQLSVFEL